MRPALALLGILWAATASAEDPLRVEVDRAAGGSLKFAVQRFADPDEPGGALAERLYHLIVEGLEYSGVIDPVDPLAFLEPLATVDDTRPMIPCDSWRAVGADALVEGSIERAQGGIRVRFRVWDVPRCRMQGDPGVYSAPEAEIGLLGRRLADELVLRFTGRRGVAATQIAFVSDKGGARELYLMEADGSAKRAVTSNGSINLFPSWNASGDTLLYTSYRSGVPDLFVLSRGRRRSGRLLNHSLPKYRGVYSPDGEQVAIVMSREGNTDIWLARRNGRGLRPLLRGRSIEVSPAWSPDGLKLAFVSDRSGSPQIYVYDMPSEKTRRLTFKGSYNASPAWSPTGEWIAFAAQTGSNFDLYLISPETGYTTPLVVHPRSDEDPVWSPDGRKIAFVSTRRGRKEIYTIDIDGQNVRRLTGDFGNSTSPAWSPWLD